MKYTAKQQRTIDYLKKLGDKTRLAEYKARLAKREADKKARREAKKQGALDAMKNIKIGDIFSASWGYDQTNVDFFQVVEIVGKCSVRIRQVHPEIVKDEACGPMCADRTYKFPTDGTLLPPCRGVFIKDTQRGDVKRVQTPSYGNKDQPYIKLSSFAWAYPEKPGLTKHYESWYA